METGIKNELLRYEQNTNRLIEALEKVNGGTGSGNTSTIQINAGGVGILVCSCLAAFIAGVGLMMGVLVVKQ